MKLFRGLAMAAAAACISFSAIGSVEAANVALLPLINNVVEREDLGAIYFDRAVAATKLDESLTIVDNSELDVAITKNLKPNTLPDKAACEAIAQAANIDYIFIMQVDKLDYKESFNTHSDGVILNLRGKCVSYNVSSGKYVAKSVDEQDVKDGSLLARYDICGNQFGDSVTREIKKALGIKKFTVEKQRIGFKGDRK